MVCQVSGALHVRQRGSTKSAPDIDQGTFAMNVYHQSCNELDKARTFSEPTLKSYSDGGNLSARKRSRQEISKAVDDELMTAFVDLVCLEPKKLLLSRAGSDRFLSVPACSVSGGGLRKQNDNNKAWSKDQALLGICEVDLVLCSGECARLSFSSALDAARAAAWISNAARARNTEILNSNIDHVGHDACNRKRKTISSSSEDEKREKRFRDRLLRASTRETRFYGRGSINIANAKLYPKPSLPMSSYTKSAQFHNVDLLQPRTFSRQQQAFDFVDNLSSQDLQEQGQGWVAPQVFAVELSGAGRRSFVVAGRAEFLRWYLALPPLRRHVYEVVREKSPCKLYFDLEFCVARNRELDGDYLVDIVVAASTALALELFGLELRRRDFIELDSSTDSKFSRHLVLNLCDNNIDRTNTEAYRSKSSQHRLRGPILFADNRECGAFARRVFEMARADLIVLSKDGEPQPFIDLAVYTRNRCFRLYLSSKFAKRAVLLPSTTRNAHPADDNSSKDVATLLEASMLCCTSESATILDVNRIISAGNKNIGAKNFDQKNAENKHVESKGFNERAGVLLPAKSGLRDSGLDTSPIPLLDAHILQHADVVAGIPVGNASLRAWEIRGGNLRLMLRGQRFCHRLGRQHRSNNVYFEIDLENASFRQGCFDPACSTFRSKSWELPPHIAELARDLHQAS